METVKMFNFVWDILQQYNLIPIIGAIITLSIIYILLKNVLARFRARGIISKGTEEAMRFASITLLALIIFAIAISMFLQVHLLAIAFIALLMMFIGMIMYATRTYIENAISYMMFVSSNIVKEGDIIEIYINDKVYKGRISIAEGGYAVIDLGDSRIYIPYNVLLKSIITKVVHNVIRFILRVKGKNLELAKLVNEVKNILSEIKIVNRENIVIKPIEVENDTLSLIISIEILNPRNIDECYDTITKLLERKLPYGFSIKFI